MNINEIFIEDGRRIVAITKEGRVYRSPQKIMEHIEEILAVFKINAVSAELVYLNASISV